jgi:KDO2-lipid IV(A) lauroyltransferase
MKLRLHLFAPRYWPTWIGLALMRLCALLPFRALMVLGAMLGALVRRLPVRYVRIARRNLELCFPELDGPARAALLRRHFRSLGLAPFETALSWWAPDRRIVKLTQVQGLEHLQAALARGRGAILFSAHFTALEIGARALAARLPVNIMYRPSKNRALAYVLGKARARRARRAIPRDDVRTLVAALRANESVWYAPDQAYRHKGAVMAPFFGIAAGTNSATSRLARATGAAVLPYFPERLPGARGYRAVIYPALDEFPSGDALADATRLNALIEAQVRRVPEQYLWIHRRFKGVGTDYPDYYAKTKTAPR